MDRENATRRASVGDTPNEGYSLVFARAGAIAPLALPASGQSIVGREPPADLVVPDDSVSRRHARILGGTPPEIEDLGSTNGTKVMGRALAPNERVPLAYGTVVELGTLVAFVQPASPLAAGSASPEGLPRGRAPETVARMTVAPPAMSAPSGPSRSPVLRDATMLRLYELIDVIAPSKLSVLILGETGVGKDVYAETVHARSPRAGGNFVRLNCAALPENLLEAELFGYEKGSFTGAMQAKPGLFEAADGGTVFLDEIGEMPLVTQAKLLRVLESGEVLRIGSVKPKRVDVRFVSATNRDLEALSATGQFRSDLFFRLNGVSVALPPLRKRPDDVVPLAHMFLTNAGGPPLSDEALASLRAYRWPGNIRELKNVVERAALLAQGRPIRVEHLLFRSASLSDVGGEPAPVASAPVVSAPTPAAAPEAPLPVRSAGTMPMRDEFAELERTRILEAMEKCGGNQSRAAKMLGISRTTLIKRLEIYQYVRPRKGQDE
ncbi:MAG: sigma 54-interacting transcriptional regulator [Deltaproteobacteria bacterium]|nr:sigma 54-interacting transcriptional regulator [Deltaproteobacteria bacterium]